jgi:hypothetical protein
VRHKRGEAVALPDGVVARMQFSPYRLQLAGIKTSPILYQPLEYEITASGVVESDGRKPQSSPSSDVNVKAEVFERDVPLVAKGQIVEVTGEALSGREPLRGNVRKLAAELDAETRTLPVWLEVNDPEHCLRPAMPVTTRIKVSAGRLGQVGRAVADDWRNRTTVSLLGHALCSPVGLDSLRSVQALLEGAVGQALLSRGQALALPESAVVDTGTRKVVYVESGPGMFDGVEVVLGPRCGDFYPVIRGLQAGQRVATSGAFLIDAETQLNPGVAATYFGATRSSDTEPPAASKTTAEAQALLGLSDVDRALAIKQRICPVTNKPLGSMGTPERVLIDGRVVFLCCAGCEGALRQNPEKYLSKLHKH